MTEEKITELIESNITLLSHITAIPNFVLWAETTSNTLEVAMPKNQTILPSLTGIIPEMSKRYNLLDIMKIKDDEFSSALLEEAKAKAEYLLINLTIDISNFGIEHFQNPSNEQLITNESKPYKSILDSIKNELTGNQFKELLSIIQSKATQDDIQHSVMEKLNSFDNQTTNKILTNIITTEEISNHISNLL